MASRRKKTVLKSQDSWTWISHVEHALFITCLHILHIREYVLRSSSYKVCKTKIRTAWNKTFISSHNYSLPDTFLAEKVRLRAFTASRKSSRKIPEASRYRKKYGLGVYSQCMIQVTVVRKELAPPIVSAASAQQNENFYRNGDKCQFIINCVGLEQ